MAFIENNIFLYDDHAEIEILHKDYRAITIIDIEDIVKLKKLRLVGKGYVMMSNNMLLSRTIMNCVKGDKMHVDHINGNILDNRKSNLRVVHQSINERNKHSFVKNNTGTIGIQYRENGNYKYYRVSWRDNNGIRFTKQFNINKLGDEKAFNEATNLLNKKHKEFKYL